MTYFPLRQTTCFFIPLVAPCKPLLMEENVKIVYFKYLGAAFGSALISSIYGLVDMAMVGYYQRL